MEVKEVHCRYDCRSQGRKCCFECSQVVEGKRCGQVCSRECWSRSGEKRPRIIELN